MTEPIIIVENCDKLAKVMLEETAVQGRKDVWRLKAIIYLCIFYPAYLVAQTFLIKGHRINRDEV